MRIIVLGAVVSLAAIYLIISQLRENDREYLLGAIRNANYGFVLAGALVIVVGLICRGWRWRVLLGNRLPFRRAFRISNVAYLLNGILPFRLGELGRVYLATQSNPPIPAALSASTIVVERLLDLLSILVIIALAFAYGDVPEELRRTAIVLAPITILMFLALMIMAGLRSRLQLLANRVLTNNRFGKALKPLIEHALDGLSPLDNWRQYALAVGLTAASWMCSVASGHLIMVAFYGQAHVGAVLLFTAMATLAVAIPAVPGNLGTYELSILLALRAMNYGDPVAVASAFAVAVHAVNLLVNASMGVIGFIQEGVSLQQLSQGVREMRPLG